MQYKLGLPMWQNATWKAGFYSQQVESCDVLREYSSTFNTVEGNTSFYAIPSVKNIQQWDEQTPRDFSFVFKLPKTITHEHRLLDCNSLCSEFFTRMAPLRSKMGPVMIQLPASFCGKNIQQLEKFIRQLSMEYSYAIELRHGDFFHGDAESRVIDILNKYRIDKVNFDSRALFSSTSEDNFTLEAKNKKPQLPVNLLATGSYPIIRFIGHEVLSENDKYFDQCSQAINSWMEQGKQPFLFAHLANNAQAYRLAKHLHQHVKLKNPALKDLPSWPAERESESGQIGLF